MGFPLTQSLPMETPFFPMSGCPWDWAGRDRWVTPFPAHPPMSPKLDLGPAGGEGMVFLAAGVGGCRGSVALTAMEPEMTGLL